MTEETIIMIPIDSLKSDPNQPRKNISEEIIASVADTIKVQGIINPIEIDENNIIVTGEIRWRGAKEAGLTEVPCRRWKGTFVERLERQIIENLHHHQLSPEERENAVVRLWETGKFTSYNELGTRLGYRGKQEIIRILNAKKVRDQLKARNFETSDLTTFALRYLVDLDNKDQDIIIEKLRSKELTLKELPQVLTVVSKGVGPISEAVLDGKVDIKDAQKAAQTINIARKEGIEVPEAIIKSYAEELTSHKTFQDRRSERIHERAHNIITGEKEPRTIVLTSEYLQEIQSMVSRVRSWGVPMMMAMGMNDWEKARRFFVEMRDWLSWLLEQTPGREARIIEIEGKEE